MSAEINNREFRKKTLMDIISQLHKGKTVAEVQEQFNKVFGNVSALEISEAESALIAEGLPVEEVQRLCDVHSAVFKGSIEEIHAKVDETQTPGHPANTLHRENRALEKVVASLEEALGASGNLTETQLTKVSELLEALGEVDIHYVRKENLFFPYLEKYGIEGPPKVMWGVDDEIRVMIKQAKVLAENYTGDPEDLRSKVKETTGKLTEMIFKEDNILLPMVLETFTQDEWTNIAKESSELGYCLISDVPEWKPAANYSATPSISLKKADPGQVKLSTGLFTVKQLENVLNTLPVDITFVDKDDTVRYFSETAERVFPRTNAIIGRKVSNCHPPASVNVVEDIVADLKSGKKDHEDFWIKMKDKYIFIRYFAVRDNEGEYLGVLEVTQDIADIQKITGEKRLVEG